MGINNGFTRTQLIVMGRYLAIFRWYVSIFNHAPAFDDADVIKLKRSRDLFERFNQTLMARMPEKGQPSVDHADMPKILINRARLLLDDLAGNLKIKSQETLFMWLKQHILKLVSKSDLVLMTQGLDKEKYAILRWMRIKKLCIENGLTAEVLAILLKVDAGKGRKILSGRVTVDQYNINKLAFLTSDDVLAAKRLAQQQREARVQSHLLSNAIAA